MIEIALCLAIMGFALVAIIGVLPLGMNAQRDNREATVINQDATVLLDAVRSGARGADDLTNFVYAIANTGSGNPVGYLNPVLAAQMNFPGSNPSGVSWYPYLTNGATIVGLLSMPEFWNGNSNHIVAYVRSLSGLASEKPPQDNGIMVGNTFTYRVYCVNAAVAYDTNSPLAGFSRQLNGNLHELRMTFLWPQLPNGKVGAGRQTFRASIAGQLAQDSTNGDLFYYQSQFFTNAP
jgi:type II secretory pathway pseudopilin PulG